MKKIRVLHLIDSNGMYGAETVVLTLLENLLTSSYHCILGCIRDSKTAVPPITKGAQTSNIPLHYFTMKRGLNLFGLQRIVKYIRDKNIRIVHSHGYKPNIYLASLPFRKFKTISTVHGWAKNTAGLKMRIYEFLDSISLKRMDRVVAVSKAVKNDLKERGLRKEKIDLIYNGIKISSRISQFDTSYIRQQFGLSNDDFVIGTAGRLTTIKGHYYLIEAMPAILREIKTCTLLIAGDGPLQNNLTILIQKLNLSAHVKLIGYINDMDQFLSMIDIFALPSLSEGLPVSLLEALALGKPVLASAVGGIPEVITHYNEGVLIPPADTLSISKAIITIFQDKVKRTRIAALGKKLVEDKFSSKAMADHYSNIYSKLLM